MNIIAASCIFPSGPGMDLAEIALTSTLSLNRKHPFYVDNTGVPIRASFFPEPKLFDITRWIALVKAALDDLYRQLSMPDQQLVTGRKYLLHLVIPLGARAGIPDQLSGNLLEAIQGKPFTFTDTHVVKGGHAAGVQALNAAGLALQRNQADQTQIAIVLAVDSWLHPDALHWLEKEDLLHNAGRVYKGARSPNPYGRVPGEAAAAVMLRLTGPAWCKIQGVGAVDEPVLRTDSRPCIGLGWTKAANDAIATLSKAQKITHIFSDLNGEPYRADQFGFTILRISDRLESNWERHTPALVTGDVGSATALVHVALSANMLRQLGSGTPMQTHLLLSSSDDPVRAALVLGNLP
ncbi:beta-ketoacyl synthase [Massilia aquatica]|uniref:Beta-ketoacyl synthase n=1 Tax=Massilia aquatica TaxID=2609000 RepID=A0ABX0LVV0_9BURK|nr:beta-ketoacyl synthase [Massilia aquatica]NHZ38966.1 beta-ketoacyl synthase [Massilia aquatica]